MSKTTLQWTLFSGSNNSLVCESLHKSVASVILFIHTVWNVNSAPGSQPLKMQSLKHATVSPFLCIYNWIEHEMLNIMRKPSQHWKIEALCGQSR